MDQQRRPLVTREDIIVLVDSFYAKVRQDELIGPIFNDVARVDWAEHLPKLYNFWSDLLLGTDEYHGRPFPPHMRLGLQIEHFERWLKLFLQTVDEHFVGIKALEAKQRALRIGQNFATNLQLIDRPTNF
jgi:hemoglobin